MPSGLPEPPVKPNKPTGPLVIKRAAEPAEAPPSTHVKLYMEVVPHRNGEVFLSYLAAQEDPDFLHLAIQRLYDTASSEQSALPDART